MNRENLNDLFFRLIEGREDRTKTIAVQEFIKHALTSAELQTKA